LEFTILVKINFICSVYNPVRLAQVNKPVVRASVQKESFNVLLSYFKNVKVIFLKVTTQSRVGSSPSDSFHLNPVLIIMSMMMMMMVMSCGWQ